MSRRSFLPARLLATAALAAGVVAIGAQTAHAIVPPGPPDATDVKMHCDNGAATWHAHLTNPGGLPAVFDFMVDNFSPKQFTIAPGATQDVAVEALDGVPSELFVQVNGDNLGDFFTQILCNPPAASITPTCNPKTGEASLTYKWKTMSDATVLFKIHRADGTDYVDSTHKGTGEISEPLANGSSYNVWVAADGKVIETFGGTADCEPATTTTTSTTTTTTVPPTTVPPTTVPPTTVPPTVTPPSTAPSSTTTSTTIAGVTTPSTPTGSPGDPTGGSGATSTDAGTGTAVSTLPYTGGSTSPLGAIGFVLMGTGGAALLILRRRGTQERS